MRGNIVIVKDMDEEWIEVLRNLGLELQVIEVIYKESYELNRQLELPNISEKADQDKGECLYLVGDGLNVPLFV